MARIVTPTGNGILVADQRRDQVLLIQDLDGDGIAASLGETTVFFDANNLSGLPAPTKNTFSVTRMADGSVFTTDGSTDTVYRLRDLNGDGDAQDAGEAQVWLSPDNAAGVSTVTPQDVAQGADGAFYITNAGVRSKPQDAIYRTVDLNGDGDANDAGETTVWLNVQDVIATAVPYDITFVGNVAYMNDLTGRATDAIYRIEDKNGDNVIDPETEVTNFITDDLNFGAPVDLTADADQNGDLYTLTWFPNRRAGEISKIYRLSDTNGSGDIDSAAEAAEVWTSASLPAGFGMFVGFNIAVQDDRSLTLTSDGNVLKLRDLNGDGDFKDDGETVVFGSETYAGQLDRPRAVEPYDAADMAPRAMAASVGAGNHFSVFVDRSTNKLYASGENVVGQLGNGSTGFDIKAPALVKMPDGFDEKIASVAGGLLHTTFLTESGDVYAFGYNNRGPLGTGDEDTRTQAVKVAALDDVQVVAIENGNSASYAITDNGVLYAWGTNSNGQLGLGDRDERLTPTVVEAFAGEKVVAVSSGVAFTLVLTADGDVYGMGAARDGQLGSPQALDETGAPVIRVSTPVKVAGLPGTVVSITADTKTSYAVTADNRVFGWGESRYGQLLQGTDNGDGTFARDGADVLEPIELTDLMPSGVIEVKAGARWGVALTKDGDVYVWGPNDQGPSGGLDGDPAAQSNAVFYPTKIAALDAVNIVEIQNGPNSIIAVADDGSIYTWGSNADGRLGFASDGAVYEPTKITLGGEADPWLVSAVPGDNDRDVAGNSALTLTFTENMAVGNGTVSLLNRSTGEVTTIDIQDSNLVLVQGNVVTITPPEWLDADARYAVSITDGALTDQDGNAYQGIETADTSTFNFKTAESWTVNDIVGTDGRNRLVGTDGDDRIVSQGGRLDMMSGGAGIDEFVFGAETNNSQRERDIIRDYEVGVDRIVLAQGTQIADIRETSSQVLVRFAGDGDTLYIRGEGVTADTLTILTQTDVLEF